MHASTSQCLQTQKGKNADIHSQLLNNPLSFQNSHIIHGAASPLPPPPKRPYGPWRAGRCTGCGPCSSAPPPPSTPGWRSCCGGTSRPRSASCPAPPPGPHPQRNRPWGSSGFQTNIWIRSPLSLSHGRQAEIDPPQGEGEGFMGGPGGGGWHPTSKQQMGQDNFRFYGWVKGQIPNQNHWKDSLKPKMLIFWVFVFFYLWKTPRHQKNVRRALKNA